MKMGNSRRYGPVDMIWFAAGAALAVVWTAVSCAPPIEPYEKVTAAEALFDGTYLTLKVVETETARSLSEKEQDGLWNYFEIITRKVERQSSAGQPLPLEGDRYYSDRGSRKQGRVSIPVETNHRYDVLLLEGYQDPRGGDPVLIRTAFVRTDWIHSGQNESLITYQRVLVQPDNDSDPMAGMLVYLTSASPEKAIRPAYVNTGSEQTLILPLPRYDAGAGYLSDAKVTLAIDGITPLIMAKKGPNYEKLDNVMFNQFFVEGRLVRDALVEEGDGRMYPAWRGNAAEDVNIGSIEGRATAQWNLGGAMEAFLPAVDATTDLYVDLQYYGFSETPVTDTATAAFTRWTIRNGANNEHPDKREDGYTNIGGLITTMFGYGGNWGNLRFAVAPRLQLTMKTNNELEYTIIASSPQAEEYTLYWTQWTQNHEKPLNDPVWHVIEHILPDSRMGTLTLSGAADNKYALAATAARDRFRNAVSETYIVDTSAPTQTFTVQPAVQAEGRNGNTIDYVIIPSSPQAAEYTLYWTPAQNSENPLSAAVWHKVEHIRAGSRTGTLAVSGAANHKYTLVVTAALPSYVDGVSAKTDVDASPDLSGSPAVLAAAKGGGIVEYTVLSSSPEAERYTLYWTQWTQNGAKPLTDAAWTKIENILPDNKTGTFLAAGALDNEYALVAQAIKTGYHSAYSEKVRVNAVPVMDFSAAPGLSMNVDESGEIAYTVIPSSPEADRYALYWTQDTENGGKPLTDAAWTKIDNILPDDLSGTVTVSGAADKKYALRVMAIKSGYREMVSGRILVDTAPVFIDVVGAAISGTGWSYNAAGMVYNITGDNQVYRIYSSTGAVSRRKIAVGSGLSNVTLNMGDAGKTNTIKLYLADVSNSSPLSIGLGSKVTVVLYSGTTAELNGNPGQDIPGHPGIHVPRGASLTIDAAGNASGRLNVYGGKYYPAIGGLAAEGNGAITIKKGNVYAYAGVGAAAIGVGYAPAATNSSPEKITIEGGTVVAEGENSYTASVIGAGHFSKCGPVEIVGGRVTLKVRNGTTAAIGGTSSSNRSGVLLLDGSAYLTVEEGGSNPFSFLSLSGNQWKNGTVRTADNIFRVFGNNVNIDSLFTGNTLTIPAGSSLILSGESTAQFAVTSAAGVTLNIPSGKTLTNNGEIFLKLGKLNGGTVYNNDGGVIAMENAVLSCTTTNRTGGTINAQNGTFEGAITNSGGTINAQNGTLTGTITNSGGTINAQNGRFEGTITNSAGGTINAQNGILAAATTNTGSIIDIRNGGWSGTLTNNGWIRISAGMPNITAGVVFVGNTGTVKTNTTLNFSPVISSVEKLTVPAGKTLTMAGGQKLNNGGTLIIDGGFSGTLNNNNGILCDNAYSIIPYSLVEWAVLSVFYVERINSIVQTYGDTIKGIIKWPYIDGVAFGAVLDNTTLGNGQTLELPEYSYLLVRNNITLKMGPGSALISPVGGYYINAPTIRNMGDNSRLDFSDITLGGCGEIHYVVDMGSNDPLPLSPPVTIKGKKHEHVTVTPGGNYGIWRVTRYQN
jgi:hypothetical protein